MHMWGPGASARARPRPRTWTRGAECASTPQVAGEEQAGEHVHELKPQELRSRLKPRDANSRVPHRAAGHLSLSCDSLETCGRRA